MIETSTDCGDLFAALAKAQAEVQAAAKDKTNPHFRNTYADLASVWDACRKPLTTNGLSVTQWPGRTEGGGVTVTTQLSHSSGQWMRSTLEMPLDNRANAQAVGSAITYGRRYALAAVAGVAPDDDDGHEASKAPPSDRSRTRKPGSSKKGGKAQAAGKPTADAMPVIAATKKAIGIYTLACSDHGVEPRTLAEFLAEASGREVEAVRANEEKWGALPLRVWEKALDLVLGEQQSLDLPEDDHCDACHHPTHTHAEGCPEGDGTNEQSADDGEENE